ncbi:MAG TPA: uroporphyrinogen-III synthase [Arenibaculum sp.]|nr:uroporphyrinogen-III synthase [Arenibaculum sp.]
MNGMPGRLLITRPEEDARPLAELLRTRGYVVSIEPMLRIEPVPGPPLDLSGVQAFLFTSANGVRACVARTNERALPAFAVGDATARSATRAGFGTVHGAGGTVDDLADLVARRCDPEDGALLHAAGSAVAGDLAGDLGRRGFTVDRRVLYAAHPAMALSESTVRAVYAGTIDAALFFSPRTAESFVRLARQAGIEERLAAVTALCLSEAVARAARTVPWREIRVAGRPEQAALVDLLENA